MKIVFMGTPDFAVPSLHALTEAGYAVAAVVTQPDKPKGRGKTLLPTPVKEEAVMHDIPVYQPEKVRNNPEFLEILKEIKKSKKGYKSRVYSAVVKLYTPHEKYKAKLLELLLKKNQNLT